MRLYPAGLQDYFTCKIGSAERTTSRIACAELPFQPHGLSPTDGNDMHIGGLPLFFSIDSLHSVVTHTKLIRISMQHSFIFCQLYNSTLYMTDGIEPLTVCKAVGGRLRREARARISLEARTVQYIKTA